MLKSRFGPLSSRFYGWMIRRSRRLGTRSPTDSDFAWRQWAQIGVSATVEGADRWAVDPEALILFTVGIGRRDPRLFDEMLDWMAFNHELLSVRRLRNLAARFPLPSGLVGAVAAWTSQSAQTAPASLPASQADRARDSEPVFDPTPPSHDRTRSSPTMDSSAQLPQEAASRMNPTSRFRARPSGSAAYSGQAGAPRPSECCSPTGMGRSTRPESLTKSDSPRGTPATS